MWNMISINGIYYRTEKAAGHLGHFTCSCLGYLVEKSKASHLIGVLAVGPICGNAFAFLNAIALCIHEKTRPQSFVLWQHFQVNHNIAGTTHKAIATKEYLRILINSTL